MWYVTIMTVFWNYNVVVNLKNYNIIENIVFDNKHAFVVTFIYLYSKYQLKHYTKYLLLRHFVNKIVLWILFFWKKSKWTSLL